MNPIRVVDVVVTTEKWCRRCDETKPVDEFRRYAGNADGRRGTCKACQKLVAADPKPGATGVRQLIVTREPWQQHAACTGVNLFFPVRGESSKQAKAVCQACPVKCQCLEYALRAREVFGVWGGTSERERRKLRRQQRAKAAVA